MYWIGIDDTDSTSGGCTTYTTYKLIQELKKNKYELIGHPYLVRLNPNIPWKTRGNGAVSIRVKTKYKKQLKKIVKEIIEKHSYLDDKKTNPGFVITDKKPSQELYQKALHDVIKIEEIEETLDSLNAEYMGYKKKRGLIGATAAISWYPQPDKTYELITYRNKKKWGKKRFVEDNSVIKMDKKFSSTFNNYDYENKSVQLAPNSPCPVLYGIRGEKPNELLKAKKMIVSEPTKGFMIFETNQGTDDHLVRKEIDELNAFESVIVTGKVSKKPFTIRGGHVIFSLEDNGSSIDCAAYEPTKDFRKTVKKLDEEDVVEVYGGMREKPFTINIEKMRVEHLAKIVEKKENPVCSSCGKHMKSVGAGKGYRCKNCGTYAEENEAQFIEKKRDLETGFYEVPVCARRHLSKPLGRGSF